jgi:hypothetical protein
MIGLTLTLIVLGFFINKCIPDQNAAASCKI